MSMFIKYNHHGADVSVRSDLQGKHRQYCLCWSCQKFKPNSEENCPKAQKLYRICVEENLTTPVFECPDFESLFG